MSMSVPILSVTITFILRFQAGMRDLSVYCLLRFSSLCDFPVWTFPLIPITCVLTNILCPGIYLMILIPIYILMMSFFLLKCVSVSAFNRFSEIPGLCQLCLFLHPRLQFHSTVLHPPTALFLPLLMMFMEILLPGPDRCRVSLTGAIACITFTLSCWIIDNGSKDHVSASNCFVADIQSIRIQVYSNS